MAFRGDPAYVRKSAAGLSDFAPIYYIIERGDVSSFAGALCLLDDEKALKGVRFHDAGPDNSKESGDKKQHREQ